MIEVYDNVLPEVVREQLYMLAINANYQIGWEDTATFENKQYPCLHHKISSQEWGELNFLDAICDNTLRSFLSKYKYENATINLATPSSIQFPHTHGKAMKVLVYYFNPEWRNEFYGETIFYDDTLSDATRTVSYKPNRAVLFDGGIPHSIRPSSIVAPAYRFTLGIFFRELNFIEEARVS